MLKQDIAGLKNWRRVYQFGVGAGESQPVAR